MSAIFLQGDAREVLRGLPGDFFHSAMTSPPYFGLRKYEGGEVVWGGDEKCEHEWVTMVKKDTRGVEGTGLNGRDPYKGGEARVDKIACSCRLCSAWRGQLGAEPTPDLYISHLVQIFREVKRVLRKDGVFWCNIGDSWASSKGQNSIKPLDMVLIPFLLAVALRADGWYMRSAPVWSKNNPMPESVDGWSWRRHQVLVWLDGTLFRREVGKPRPTEVIWQACPGCPKCSPNDGYVLRKGSWRPTDSYEFILMLTKTNNYYCDREAVLELNADPKRTNYTSGKRRYGINPDRNDNDLGYRSEFFVAGGRNLRSVWEFPTLPGKFNHYAAYPPRLPEICIKSSISEKGCCPSCGAPWARVIDKGFTAHDGVTDTQYDKGTNANRLALLRQAARKRGGEYGGLNYNSKYKVGGVTGLATQGFQRNATIEAERERSREEAALRFPDDDRAQQDYINHIHDHGGLDKGKTIGWRPTCSCPPDNPVPCRVLDPLSGAGTTALVSERLGLDSFSIDTSAEYIALSKDRLVADEQKRIDEFVKKAKRLACTSVKSRGNRQGESSGEPEPESGQTAKEVSDVVSP